MPSRRVFLKHSALAMFGVGSAPAWLTRALYGAEDSAARKRVLVVIFQRGAVDGLNVVVPHAERAYYALRPSIAIPRPDGTEGSAIDLDGRFGLNPALRALKPLWDRRLLAIVEAAGSPDPTRSHFDAQDYMESGTPGVKVTPDGWLNRALASPSPDPMRAVSMTPDLPRMLRGRNEALAVGNINDFDIRDRQAAPELEALYEGSADRILNGTARETFEAVKMMRAIRNAPYVPAGGANYPNSRFGGSMRQIARMIKANAGVEVAFADIGGWDTHVNETGAHPHEGQLANRLRDFGDSLAAFCADMGDRLEDVTLVTMSEFGRTVKENGNRGTDHGHANVMLVMGGGVKGGRVYGEWPGLEREQLYEGRDLNITTDFRTVLSELVGTQMGNRDLQAVFPGFDGPRSCGLLG